MADLYLYLDLPSAVRALHVLAETARQLAAAKGIDSNAALRHLALIRVKCPRNRFEKYRLFFQDYSVFKRDKKDLDAKKTTTLMIQQAYQHITSSQLVADPGPLPPEALEWATGVVRLLRESAPQGGESARQIKEEVMLLGRNLSDRRAAEILGDLSFYATHTLVATTKAREGSYDLYHVEDDPERKSAFKSALAGGFFADCAVSACFQSDGAKIFLPDGFKPTAEALVHFGHLVETAWPAFFEGDRIQRRDERLVAVHEWQEPTENGDSGRTKYGLIGLVGLEFASQIRFLPLSESITECEAFDLRTSAARAAHLREDIAQSNPPVGYRLQLRHTRYREYSDVQFELLSLRKQEIEYQLAYLESISQPRPTLYRFDQRQLPAMADLLRNYPGSVLQQGGIKYGFQATSTYPAGVHFLYVDPHVLKPEMEPLIRWKRADDPPMRFWLDPFWARYYYNSANNCLVFVPYGRVLEPSMHGWAVDSMDDYMRAIMSEWFHGEFGVGSIPAHPIYLFDGEADSDAGMEISVLDYDALQPLQTRLGWLTDQLVILHHLGGEQFVEEMARLITQSTFDESFRLRAQKSKEDFEEAAQNTSEHIAKRTQSLTQVITQELSRIVEETEQMTSDIRSLNQDLMQLRALYGEMSRRSQEAETLVGQTTSKADETRQYREQLSQKVHDQLRLTDALRANVEAQVTASIDSLVRTRQALKQRLANLRMLG